MKKRSWKREKSILERIRKAMGQLFVRGLEDGSAVDRWYRKLIEKKDLTEGTAVRHFNVMHHLLKKAATCTNRRRSWGTRTSR